MKQSLSRILYPLRPHLAHLFCSLSFLFTHSPVFSSLPFPCSIYRQLQSFADFASQQSLEKTTLTNLSSLTASPCLSSHISLSSYYSSIFLTTSPCPFICTPFLASSIPLHSSPPFHSISLYKQASFPTRVVRDNSAPKLSSSIHNPVPTSK